MSENIAVFVAWPYANGDLHLGHVAGAYLPADIFARYHRLRGNNVLMASGSDAHGTPITLKAKQENRTPKEVVEQYHKRFLEGWERLGITFDLFTLTHTKNHEEIVQRLFTKLLENGDLSIKKEKQFYDEQAEMFLPDRYVTGTCPKCSYERARGDQCEDCGSTFSSVELLNPISTISETTPVVRDTEHYFFEMSRYKDRLLEYVSKQAHWRPAVQRFTQSMIEGGLPARAITRDIDWGVPVPVEGWEEKVIYVWIDAVVGYLSASVEWAKGEGDETLWENWWKDDEARSYYFLGKDNVPFHTVIWPIELMGFDPDLNLPYDVPANQFLQVGGEKLSTSRGLAIWLLEVLDRFDADAVRYYLASILPENKDSSFTWEGFQNANNGELAAAWGNLVQRVIGFTVSKFEGLVPEPVELEEIDQKLLDKIDASFTAIGELYEAVKLRDATKETMALAREVNKYLDETAPWTTIKTDEARAKTSIYVALQAINSLALLFSPILPQASTRIRSMLGIDEALFGEQERTTLGEGEDTHETIGFKPLKGKGDRWKPVPLAAGTSVSKADGPLFKLLDDEAFQAAS